MTPDTRLCGELRGSHLDVPTVLQPQEVREQRGTSPSTENRLRWDSKIDIEVDHAAQKLMTVSCTAKVAEAVVAALTDAGPAVCWLRSDRSVPSARRIQVAKMFNRVHFTEGCQSALRAIERHLISRHAGYRKAGRLLPA
ncbi:hypothetical protein AK812_SmicGene28230 [Symbiodinium microadriaticum]|uniref:Uncharacterized protein n=1 Tax=Symbiodinium microadriaticum TaxID=2951 RepID=A0A1Q9D4W2_SYMMI|nr:hypothetical protein AK812_SmicGene28230 [Symbiodinium microadriaticum]